MDYDGNVIAKRRFQTSESNLRKAFAELKGEIHVHLEAGELAAWTREVIKPYVKTVTVGHARDNAWIAKDPNKSDKVDAFKLADLLRMKRVHPVYYADDRRRRDFKELVQHYEDLTAQEVALKAMIKSRFRTQGVLVHNAAPFTQQGFKKTLAQVASRELRPAILQLYKLLVHTLELREAARSLMLKAGRRFPEIKLFRKACPAWPIRRPLQCLWAPHRFSKQAVALLPAGYLLSQQRGQALAPSWTGLAGYSRYGTQGCGGAPEQQFKRAYARGADQHA
jgi:hypothetical protein